MSAEAIAEAGMRAGEIYLAVGLAFAAVFVLYLAPRVDPSVPGSSWGFRLIIIPGVTLLWPLLVIRVVRGQRTPTERTAHRVCAARLAAQHAARRTDP